MSRDGGEQRAEVNSEQVLKDKRVEGGWILGGGGAGDGPQGEVETCIPSPCTPSLAAEQTCRKGLSDQLNEWTQSSLWVGNQSDSFFC